jgi:hypothetical protein
MAGLPGAGKTMRAQSLAAERAALRPSPDDWMIPLFGEPEAGGKRDVLEGRLIWLALEAPRNSPPISSRGGAGRRALGAPCQAGTGPDAGRARPSRPARRPR